MAILSTDYLDFAFVSEDPAQKERIKAILSSDSEGKMIVKNFPANGFGQNQFIIVPNSEVTIVDNFKLRSIPMATDCKCLPTTVKSVMPMGCIRDCKPPQDRSFGNGYDMHSFPLHGMPAATVKEPL
ncbi:uncharacterized protein LY89DRAFT_727351 [Mollisia scopiformis]|uniref:Uncharacterized protein n=1 Tax=Mollisia scopiformis TaxID=149040 RepID=A0A194XWC3_MOLSC|nr:uncharacterized protein LY89DRAFT_727351 [Mollisia scopiformis]KUJ24319.1 hypothetical protein LY89DRAFT_727351 [Mollisia scopiformis]